MTTIEYLHQQWKSVFRLYENTLASEKHFNALLKAYSGKGRQYHTLEHITAMIQYAEQYKTHLEEPEIVIISIFYHDIIYNTFKKDNEEKSAACAEERLNALGYPADKIATIKQFIIATKTHSIPEGIPGDDINYFLDFDLAVLGASYEKYTQYTKWIRKEYWFYPGFMYRAGRKTAMEHFLKKERIYKTSEFYSKYEKQARENIRKEITLLN